LQRNRDSFSKWADTGAVTTVNLEKGAFLIEHKPGEYHFIFRDIDRERYCGMEGVINGSLTIKRGNDQCILQGDIMVEGTPLGEAVAKAPPESPAPAAGASDIERVSAPKPAAGEQGSEQTSSSAAQTDAAAAPAGQRAAAGAP
jgi:hypothetical protein